MLLKMEEIIRKGGHNKLPALKKCSEKSQFVGCIVV